MIVEIIESIFAWFDTPAHEETRRQLDLQKYIIEKPYASVLIHVKGDSMQDAGIIEGDIVVVDKSKSPKVWDVVVACVDSKYTLKFFDKDTKGSVFLRAGNPRYSDIIPTAELEIFGVVVSLVRKY